MENSGCYTLHLPRRGRITAVSIDPVILCTCGRAPLPNHRQLHAPIDQENTSARLQASSKQPPKILRFTPRILTVTRFRHKSAIQPKTQTNGHLLGVLYKLSHSRGIDNTIFKP